MSTNGYGNVGTTSLRIARRTKYKTAQSCQYCSHQVTHAYSGCIARRLGATIGDGPETVGCGDPGRSKPRRAAINVLRASEASRVGERGGLPRPVWLGMQCSRASWRCSGCTHSRREDQHPHSHRRIPNQPNSDQGPQPKLKTQQTLPFNHQNDLLTVACSCDFAIAYITPCMVRSVALAG